MKTRIARVALLLLAMATTVPALGASADWSGHADTITSATTPTGRTGPIMERY